MSAVIIDTIFSIPNENYVQVSIIAFLDAHTTANMSFVKLSSL